MDDFRVTPGNPPMLPLRITPSVSPIFKNNPAFSVMTYDLKNGSAADITTYFLALSSKTPSWAKEYQFSIAYGVHAFSGASLSAIAAHIRRGGAARRTFEKDYAASTPSPIHPSNFFFYACAQTDFTTARYRECVCHVVPPLLQPPAP